MISGAPAGTVSADSVPRVPGADSLSGVPEAAVTVREVPWHHLAAVALREALAQEVLLRYGELLPGHSALGSVFGADAATVAYSAVAFTAEGLPVGCMALRWAGDDVELAGLYVAPSHRHRGVAATLLAAAVAVAGRLGADQGGPAQPAGSQRGTGGHCGSVPTGSEPAAIRLSSVSSPARLGQGRAF